MAVKTIQQNNTNGTCIFRHFHLKVLLPESEAMILAFPIDHIAEAGRTTEEDRYFTAVVLSKVVEDTIPVRSAGLRARHQSRDHIPAFLLMDKI